MGTGAVPLAAEKSQQRSPAERIQANSAMSAAQKEQALSYIQGIKAAHSSPQR